MEEEDEIGSLRSSQAGLTAQGLNAARSSTSSLRLEEDEHEQEYAQSHDHEQPADQMDNSSTRSASRASRSSKSSHGKFPSSCKGMLQIMVLS
jgi:hypothetical protein